TVVFFFFLFTTVEIPAFVFLGIWFLFQFLNGITEPIAGAGGVATWAHIGGFVAGLYFARKWNNRPKHRGASWS
ncbi:MAG: rhomboid family intramembrane serine protease, partial [Armatimonadetes bacterium]|nr:rhomboid family intramembrane serine protease [Armatimonadota bacterium]